MRRFLVIVLACASAHAQWLNYKTAGIPRSPDGKPNPALFKADKLHMLPAGYALWRDTLKPLLLQRELPNLAR